MKKAGSKVEKVAKNSLYGKLDQLAKKHSPIQIRETKHYKEFKMRFPRAMADRMDSRMQKECFVHNVRNLMMAQGMDEMFGLHTMMAMAIADAMHIAPEEAVQEMVDNARKAALESIKLCGCKYEPPPVHQRN